MTGTGSEVSWLLPVAKEAWKHRAEIQSFWERLATHVRGTKFALGCTGMAGVGKTVLLDHITGAALKAGYKPPSTSQSGETGKFLAPGKRISLTVAPGQSSSPRLTVTDSLFSGKEPIHGLIHVVANGFTAIRTPDARRHLIKEQGLTTIEAFTAFQRGLELRDLDETCNLIRQLMRKHKKPFWMIVAVSKVDLYQDRLSDAESYYSPAGNSEFVKRITQLEHQVGADNFRWTARPVCSWPEDFEWNNHKVTSTFKTPERDHYLAGFQSTIESYATKASVT